MDVRPVVAGGEPTPQSPLVLTLAAYAALAVLGFVVGVMESFTFSWSVAWFPLAAALICAVNYFLLRSAGWGMGGKLGATVPAATWLLALVMLSIRTPSGGLIVTGTTAGTVYLVGGVIVAIFAISLTPSAGQPGDWLLAGSGRQPRRM
jgi:Family of unknown function (DUF6113)